jgi:DNA processing protein
MRTLERTVEALKGSLNDVEQKYAPRLLWCQGDDTILRHFASVSIVGSRKVSSEGRNRAKRLAKILAQKNIAILSGLAEGVDTIAHQTAIDCQGKTVGVIGTPIDRFYPKQNEALQRKISEEHLLVSQFQIGTPTRPTCFPQRNRTMALLSDATIIVEASDGSGSLHQGWEALRLGRPLFILKSSVDDQSLKWPKELMNYGAMVLSNDNIDDLFDSLPAGGVTIEI